MSEVLVLLIEHDGNDSPAVALARNRVELLEQVKVAVWGDPHPADTTNDAGDDMAEGMTDTLLETGVMAFEGDPPLRLVRIPVDWFAAGVGGPVNVLRDHHPNCGFASMPEQPANCSCPPRGVKTPLEGQP